MIRKQILAPIVVEFSLHVKFYFYIKTFYRFFKCPTVTSWLRLDMVYRFLKFTEM